MGLSDDESDNSDIFFDVDELKNVDPIPKGLNWSNEVAECCVNEYQVIKYLLNLFIKHCSGV